MFNIRAVIIDHYISKSITELYDVNDPNRNGHWVEPVIRIFGSTPEGVKSCIHVHGVYPYIYVPYKGGDNPDRDALILGAALEEALKITYNQHKNKFVHKVIVTSGIPLYGYHSSLRQFFKIFFYNPYHIRKASELLLNGAILGQKLQPHESHIPYILQFMMDYNIYGMSFVGFSKIKHRKNPDNPELYKAVEHPNGILSDKVPKMTRCFVEGDALAVDITNRNVERGLSANPGLRGIWQSEKMRRKAENLPSQFTAEESLSRRSDNVYGAELMYKDRLTAKLRDILPAVSIVSEDSEEPQMTYPAEVPEACSLLEASVLLDRFEIPTSNEQNLPDVSLFIDEKVLSQQMSQGTEGDNEEDEEGIEDESILGKNINVGDEEAELEKDEEDGGDMTQPLDVEEDVAAPFISATNSVVENQEFWKNMADKILQIDGAQDSSSDSDVDSKLKPTPGSMATATVPTAIPVSYLLERDFGGESAKIIGSSESTTITTNVSNSILTFLSEAGRSSVPLLISQPLAASWSDISLAPPIQLQESSWSWDRNEIPFGDLLAAPKNQIACEFSEVGGRKSSEDSNSADSLRSLFEPHQLFNNYGDMPSLSPCSNMASTYSESSPTSNIPSPPRFDACTDANVNSVANGPTLESSGSPSAVVPSFASFISDGSKNKVSDACDKPTQLTLKEYLKDFGEVVSVDLKTFNEREMVVIEYKPSSLTVSGQNKFVIKPLDKFLENWSNAEKKFSEGFASGGERKRFETSDEGISSNFSRSNSSYLKMNEVSSGPGEKKTLKNRGDCECFQVKTKCVKEKESKEKVGVKKGKGETVGACRSCNSRKNKTAGERAAEEEENRLKCEKKLDELILNKWKEDRRSPIKRKDTNLDEKKRRNEDESNRNLINRINSCFEDYFQNIVKVNNNWKSNSNNLCGKEELDDFGDRSTKEKAKVKRFSRSLKREDSKRKIENSDSVKMVAQLLSEFSKMSQTREMPPLQITINIGNRSESPPRPVRVNLRNSSKCERDRGKSCRASGKLKKLRIPNVDGTADGSSSSEDALESSSEQRRTSARTTKKNSKNDKCKRLNVAFQRSPNKISERKRKRSLCSGADEEKGALSGRKDSVDNFRENRLTAEEDDVRLSDSKKNIVKQTVSVRNLPSTSFEVPVSHSSSSSSSSFLKDKSKEEQDIIYDSDDGLKSKVLRLRPRKKKRKTRTERQEKIENPVVGSGSENSKPETCTPKNASLSEFEDSGSQSSCIMENVFNSSLSELDRTRYRIPAKWFGPKSVASEQPAVTCFRPEKESSNDSIGMSLSGSPLCSPADRPVTSSGSQTSREEDSNLNLTPRNESEFDLSASSSATLKPDHEESPEPYERSLSSSEFPFKSCDFHNVISLTHEKVIRPMRKPPTKDQVRSFITANRHMKEEIEVPFYSDARDLTKAMEAGPVVLKVETTAYSGLKPFKSSLDLLGIEERRALILNVGKEDSVRYLLVPDRNIIITPLKKPPSTSSVLKSLKSMRATNQVQREKPKTKVMMPLSPGQDSHSEEEMDLSLSVSTLKDEGDSQVVASSSSFSKNWKSSGRSTGTSQRPVSSLESGSEILPKSELKKLTEERENSSGTDKASTELVLKEKVDNSDKSYLLKCTTLENTFGFDNSVENLQKVKLEDTYQYVTMLVIEVHVETRENFCPDPQQDAIKAIFYTVTFDSPNRNDETGIIVEGGFPLSGGFRPFNAVHRVSKESDLILKMVDLINGWDPDILAGYEIEMHSWGYLIQRGFFLEINLISLLGRILVESTEGGKTFSEKGDFDDVSNGLRDLRIPGRIVLDIWRALRHEVALTSYTFENVMYHLSQERHPKLSYRDLSFFWNHPTNLYRHITIDYYLIRVTGIVKILDRLDFLNRTSEFARLFGIQFYEVLSRGSQFRVESMMLRLAKPLNYVPVSPSVSQRAAMRAPASLPLILEPESAFYGDPVIVLDFQSLYPSMIIAYNYCFSTCLGRVEKLGGREPFEFGCTQLQISPEELKGLENDITISPAGVAFVKENIRKGILPRMLEEILDTRLMVKKSMKRNKGNKLLEKVLFSQQLGLKLIANVTYGYTAANFSGRMPSIEVGDSVVSKGRETLHRAIQLVKNNSSWKARVVYGDTDSIFVLVPGRSRREAFQIGAEIAEAVTRDNPKPVKLKLEKVYQPCILQTKKRYVGYMYECPDQSKPVFEAKGIETVRRDGCPAVGKILRKALEILFETKDVSLVKKYTVRQFSKLFQGRVNIQDLIFAKEYRGKHGYRPGACVPALQLARQWTRLDKRAEPRIKERVPYVIVNGPPGVPLIKLVRSPMDLVKDSGLHINAFYYITKAIIPPLHRCFSLMGVDVACWYAEMPKKFQKRYQTSLPKDQKKTTISQYFTTVECIVCSNITTSIICLECQVRPQVSTVVLMDRIRRWERCFQGIDKICQSCCKSPENFECISLDCPVLFRKIQASRDLLKIPETRRALETGENETFESQFSSSLSTSETQLEFENNFINEFEGNETE